MNKKSSSWKNHKEVLVFLYFPVYLLWFFALEQMSPENLFVVTNPLDSYIPFCEYFIIPYLLWFPYLFGGILWFYVRERKDGFIELSLSLVIGLTVCLLIYTVFPNAQCLRPENYPDNLFGELVKMLQGFDTPTNVCPSIHVFSTIAIHVAVMKSQRLKRVRGIQAASFVLACLICVSTVCLKQHSLTDVLCALGLNVLMVLAFYGWNRAHLCKKIPKTCKNLPFS